MIKPSDKGLRNDPVVWISKTGSENRFDLKRLDLIHPEVNGNKFFKLKYNLEAAMQSSHRTILTFGGPWSNHIHATAATGALTGIKTIGIIRGEEPVKYSNTLEFARNCGMQLEFIERLAYAEKETEDFKGWLHDQYGLFHLVPEGGSNFLGINGCLEILSEPDTRNYEVVCCACGTGATAAGLLMKMKDNQKLMAFSSMKNGGFLKDEIFKHIRYFLMDDEAASLLMSRVEVVTDYHFGGYGKWTEELKDFIDGFQQKTGIALDQVYTGKMIYGLTDMMSERSDLKDAKILAIHTGGLQGRAGMNF